jgi:hypothetical protein
MAKKTTGAVYNTNINLRQAEFEKVLEGLLAEIASEAQVVFLEYLNTKNVELTGELKHAFNTFVISFAEEFGGYVEFNFGQYGRFKDLKYTEYRSMWSAPTNTGKKYNKANPYPDDALPNSVLGMIKYIEEKGLDNFTHIPGYKKGSMPATTRAIKRLAWTLAAARMKLDRVRNKKTYDWYTKSIMAIRKRMAPKIQTSVAEFLTNGHYSTLWEQQPV